MISEMEGTTVLRFSWMDVVVIIGFFGVGSIKETGGEGFSWTGCDRVLVDDGMMEEDTEPAREDVRWPLRFLDFEAATLIWSPSSSVAESLDWGGVDLGLCLIFRPFEPPKTIPGGGVGSGGMYRG